MDWDEAGSRADRRLWWAFFWVGVGLLVLAVINVAFALSDPPANRWQYLYPVFSVLAGVAILIYSRKDMQRAVKKVEKDPILTLSVP